MSLFKVKDHSQTKLGKTVYGGETEKYEESIIKSTKNLFKLQKEMKQLKIE